MQTHYKSPEKYAFGDVVTIYCHATSGGNDATWTILYGADFVKSITTATAVHTIVLQIPYYKVLSAKCELIGHDDNTMALDTVSTIQSASTIIMDSIDIDNNSAALEVTADVVGLFKFELQRANI